MMNPPATPADDRDSLDGPVEPGVITALTTLYALWIERDVAYAKATKSLTGDQVETVRQFRMKEVNDLPPALRAKAWAKAKTWYPPQHGQGTGADAHDGLRSWL